MVSTLPLDSGFSLEHIKFLLTVSVPFVFTTKQLSELLMKISKNVEFQIVRAFYTDEQVRQDFGIYANFSGKLVVDGIDVVALNDLSLRVSKDGVSYIGSQSRKIDSGYIYACGFYPKGSLATQKHENEQQARTDKFITELTDEINVFIANARARFEEKENTPRKVPNTLAKLVGTKPMTPRGKKNEQSSTSKNNTDNVPF